MVGQGREGSSYRVHELFMMVGNWNSTLGGGTSGDHVEYTSQECVSLLLR